MVSRLSLNQGLARCFVFCLLLIGTSQAAGVDRGLFTPYEGPLRLDPLAVNRAIVLRQRLVTIRLELLPQTRGQAVFLNLFDDVVVQAICDGLEANVSEGFVWNGHTQDPATGLVTFSVVGQNVVGTVGTPALTYHIRSFRDGVHVIREIRLPARRSERFPAETVPSPVEQEVAELVNLEREIQNLRPLTLDDGLGDAARGHSADMAEQNYFSHTSLDGQQFYQRITAAGYPYSTCGENIATGYSTPQAVMNGWMNSPGHRANILNAAFCDIGVGYTLGAASTYGHYWTQDFGRLQGVSVCSPVEYLIVATAGSHGTISPSGSVKVPRGRDPDLQDHPRCGLQGPGSQGRRSFGRICGVLHLPIGEREPLHQCILRSSIGRRQVHPVDAASALW
jgi:hypothetical protein